MIRVVFTVFTLFASLVLSTGIQAQEGHPFVGTWRGKLVDGNDMVPVVLIMSFDGEHLQGMVNPGRNSFPLQSVVHDAPNWRITATATSKQNESIGFTGVMGEIGARDRYIEGTWDQGGRHYSFRITRE